LAFGLAVKRARSLKPWTLEQLGFAVKPAVGKSFISKIENGRKEGLNSHTVGRFIKALDLDEVWIDKFLDTDATDEDDETKAERDADRLMQMVTKSETIPQSSEDLLIVLANQHAEGNYTDQSTAFVGLTKALEAAERIRKRGEMPADNTGSQLNAVMAEVAKLNAYGALDEANDLLDVEEKRMREEHKAVKERQDEQNRRLLEQRLDQDRLRDDPTAAADRLIRDLMRQAPAGGVCEATSKLISEWLDRGKSQGDPFDLRVALMLANRNLKRAKGFQKGAALHDLGVCRRIIGERSVDLAFLQSAEKVMRAALKAFSKAKSRGNWSKTHVSLGSVLASLGERQKDPVLLRDSINTFEAALSIMDIDKDLIDWPITKGNLSGALFHLGELEQNSALIEEAISAAAAAFSFRSGDKADETNAQNNLSLAIYKRGLGRLTKNATLFDEAQTHYEEALRIWSPEKALYDWANTIGGLGELALDRFALDQNPLHLDEAERRLLDAKPVMEKGHEPAAERCDDLLAQIAVARATVA
jgi:tetratricopeptide (TPR) repeat protein